MSPSLLKVRSQSAAAAGIAGLLARWHHCVSWNSCGVLLLLPHTQECPVGIVKPAIAIVDPVAVSNVGVRHFPEH
ncbi:hypothetical protein CC86DRAFT_433744 [Ophiobolus disseminans]|uniref:Uncharacterized protein n=1 Tax=Ophiobolus disseminans TaxID=1469910 RepID=A0A6A6ZBM9_9PLEO|nr:hypothetical protein CC86DRAFT_433744 [Ophiobolus disseminans]